MSSSIDEAAEDREDAVQGDDPDEVNVNENAVTSEAERRTIELEIPIDGVHATAVDQLKRAGVPLEDILVQRLRPTTEDVIHQVLQEAKYS